MIWELQCACAGQVQVQQSGKTGKTSSLERKGIIHFLPFSFPFSCSFTFSVLLFSLIYFVPLHSHFLCFSLHQFKVSFFPCVTPSFFPCLQQPCLLLFRDGEVEGKLCGTVLLSSLLAAGGKAALSAARTQSLWWPGRKALQRLKGFLKLVDKWYRLM